MANSESKWISDHYDGKPCTLNGKPAKVTGRRAKQATIVPDDPKETGIIVSWSEVQMVFSECGGNFTK